MSLATIVSCAALVLSLCGTLAAQTPPESAPPDFLEDARKYVIQTVPQGVRLELNEQSLLNWTNPLRQQERGATFVWMHQHRPYAIATFFTYVYNEKVNVKHEFQSLAPVSLRATFDGVLAWTPKGPGVVWKELTDAPAPAATRVGRLLQMRQLAREFQAELTSPKNERTQLRLAPRPLLEFSSPETGVADGVILSFVLATDPEALMMMEAYDQTINQRHESGFRYAFARFHYWDVAAFRGDEKVWQAPLDKAHENNEIGDPKNISKIYNSFHPYRGPKALMREPTSGQTGAVP